MGSAELFEWKRNVGIGLVHDLALWRPVGTNNDFVVVMKDTVSRRVVENRVAVNGSHKDGMRLRHTAYFIVKARHIEPVQRLRNGNGVGGAISKAAVLGWS